MSFSSEYFKGVVEDLSPPPYTVSVLGGKAAYVDGFSDVLSLGDERMRFRIRGGALVVEGEELRLLRLEQTSAVVGGRIGGYRVEFSR